MHNLSWHELYMDLAYGWYSARYTTRQPTEDDVQSIAKDIAPGDLMAKEAAMVDINELWLQQWFTGIQRIDMELF